MTQIRCGRFLVRAAERTESGTMLSDADLYELASALRDLADDPLRGRVLRSLSRQTSGVGHDDPVPAIVELARLGRLVVERIEPIALDPGPALDPLTLARLAGEPLRGDDAEDYAVGIELIGEDDQPIAGVRYRIELPDGKICEGRTGPNGRAVLWGLSGPGQCKVQFPDLDAEAWEWVDSIPLA